MARKKNKSRRARPAAALSANAAGSAPVNEAPSASVNALASTPTVNDKLEPEATETGASEATEPNPINFADDSAATVGTQSVNDDAIGNDAAETSPPAAAAGNPKKPRHKSITVQTEITDYSAGADIMGHSSRSKPGDYELAENETMQSTTSDAPNPNPNANYKDVGTQTTINFGHIHAFVCGITLTPDFTDPAELEKWNSQEADRHAQRKVCLEKSSAWRRALEAYWDNLRVCTALRKGAERLLTVLERKTEDIDLHWTYFDSLRVEMQSINERLRAHPIPEANRAEFQLEHFVRIYRFYTAGRDLAIMRKGAEKLKAQSDWVRKEVEDGMAKSQLLDLAIGTAHRENLMELKKWAKLFEVQLAQFDGGAEAGGVGEKSG